MDESAVEVAQKTESYDDVSKNFCKTKKKIS